MPRPTDALAIGLMSGTSVDGIDAVLAALAYHAGQLARVDVLACAHHPIPADLTAQIHALMLPGENEIDRAGAVHIQLAELYAAAARALIDRSSGEIAVIGCHGQTIRHRADAHPAFTWQLGCGATLAQRTRLPVVTDFRSADIACGGQGAPFAPALHRAIFASDTEHRAIVNLGGIANLTHLPSPGTGEVIGFDTGPANTLLDDWYRRHHPGGFDQAGAWAAQGRVSDPLLRFLLSDAYFSRAAPKSTGREMFNRHWLERKLDRFADRVGRDALGAAGHSSHADRPDRAQHLRSGGGFAAVGGGDLLLWRRGKQHRLDADAGAKQPRPHPHHRGAGVGAAAGRGLHVCLARTPDLESHPVNAAGGDRCRARHRCRRAVFPLKQSHKRLANGMFQPHGSRHATTLLQPALTRLWRP